VCSRKRCTSADGGAYRRLLAIRSAPDVFVLERRCKGLLGKPLDLRHACKQFPVLASHRGVSSIAVRDPRTGLMAFLQQWALAFGQLAAVLVFNSMARAVKPIAAVLFGWSWRSAMTIFRKNKLRACTIQQGDA
jgi:hypothetical protein